MLTPHVVSSNDSDELIDRTRKLIDDLPLEPDLIKQMQRGNLEASGGEFGPSFEPMSDEAADNGN